MTTTKPRRTAPAVATLRAKVAAVQRHHPDDTQALEVLRRDLRAEMLAEHIRKTVEAAPPLTPEQRDRLALLLRGGDAA